MAFIFKPIEINTTEYINEETSREIFNRRKFGKIYEINFREWLLDIFLHREKDGE